MKAARRLTAGAAALLLAAALQIGQGIAAGIPGDVNGDGMQTAADAAMLQRWLLCGEPMTDGTAADVDGDGVTDIFDMALLRRALLPSPALRTIRVTDTAELKAALADAQPGDEILLAPGTYVYSGSTRKGRMFTGEAEGTEAAPIVLRSEDPADPATLSGITTEGSYVLTILGAWWEVRDLKITNASKGIIVDHADHTKIIGCEVWNIGAEGIHFRDNSSYCLAERCKVHDTGLVKPGYGEAIYVGSAKSTTDYGHDCHYNTIRYCELGPNVAAEHIDVKEYTIGTLIEYCTFDGTGMSGENYADSFVDLKGNDCVLRYCTGYRNGCEKINRAFELNRMDEGWGRDALIYGNTAYMDTAVSAVGKKMVMVNAWDCSLTVWDNQMAYEDGVLFSCDDPEDRWNYYNCNELTYGTP